MNLKPSTKLGAWTTGMGTTLGTAISVNVGQPGVTPREIVTTVTVSAALGLLAKGWSFLDGMDNR